jgi:preprotein translocase subunit SecD
MTWRRMAPWVIAVVALLAIFIDLPRSVPAFSWLPNNVLGAEFRTVLGLDLEGGLRVTLEAQSQGDEEVTAEQVGTARDIIERRVAGIGVTEPQVRTETAGDGSRRIVVEVPGVSDQAQIRDLVGSTGQLQFIDPQGQ